MPKLPQGMFRRKGRSGWYMRLYRAGGERWISLGSDFGEACDRARALAAGAAASTTGCVLVGSDCMVSPFRRWRD